MPVREVSSSQVWSICSSRPSDSPLGAVLSTTKVTAGHSGALTCHSGEMNKQRVHLDCGWINSTELRARLAYTSELAHLLFRTLIDGTRTIQAFWASTHPMLPFCLTWDFRVASGAAVQLTLLLRLDNAATSDVQAMLRAHS